MLVFLCCEDFGDLHVYQLPIRKMANYPLLRIPGPSPSVQKDFDWIFNVICCLHFFLVPHQVYGHYLAVPNLDPAHNFNKILFGILHLHVFRLLYPLVVYGCDGNFIEVYIHVFD